MTARSRRERPLILITADDPEQLQMTVGKVQGLSYEIDTVTGVVDAAAAARRSEPDLILLDVEAATMGGPEACSAIRKLSTAPLVLLSPLISEEDAIEAFTAGADDYIVKPVGARLLAARISAVLRRAQRAGPPLQATVQIGGLTIDFDQRSVSRGGNEIALTPTEFRILEALVRNRGRVLANTELAAEIWGATAEFDDHLLRVNISRLRKKVEEHPSSPQVIVTRPRAGYLIARAD